MVKKIGIMHVKPITLPCKPTNMITLVFPFFGVNEGFPGSSILQSSLKMAWKGEIIKQMSYNMKSDKQISIERIYLVS